MGSPSIPNPWNLNMNLAGGLDMDLDNIHIKEVNLPIIKLETDSKLDAKTDSKLAATTDSIIRIKELPVIRLKMGMDPTRIHTPLNYKFGVAVLGMQLLSFDICGEGMVIIEDYKPHQTEQCN